MRRLRFALVAVFVLLAPLVFALPATTAQALAEPPSDQELARDSLRVDLTKERFYFVMADRFANGSQANDTGGLTGSRLETGFDPTDKGFYHGGDLAGLIQQLDYIKGLGSTAIWMTPSFKNRPVQGEGANASAGYHGYWITDFTQIDPHLGTNDDLKQLIQLAHAKGMKVFFDIITNHTADVVDYAEKQYSYRTEGAYPYLDANNRPFDDSDYAGKPGFPDVTTDSFPYTPVFRTEQDETVKVPQWLNDPTMYHNRGDTTFAGESAEPGDFFGLDDLWTERPEVVDGLTDIYKTWVEDAGVDGFRIDTVKHVNLEFWQAFAPELKTFAAQRGNDDFFMFGEIFDSNPAFVSRYTTNGKLQAALDFPFQSAARGFASQGQATNALRDLFASDDYYTDTDSNVYSSPTFLGNHDMGRIGSFIASDNPGATDTELLQRDKLAHALLYLSRGQPVVYYGDEQGFTGPGGDKDARQTLFASQTADYLDDDLIGTTATHAQDNFDPNHPLYKAITELAALTTKYPTLRDGAQIHRLASDGPGVYAFSRVDAANPVEYLVALNNAETAQTVRIPTYSAGMVFRQLWASGTATRRALSAADKTIEVEVPPLGGVVLQAHTKAAPEADGPAVTLTVPNEVRGRAEISANVAPGGFAQVTFAAKVGDGDWSVLGTDDNAPYRIFHDTTAIPAGTSIEYKAVVKDAAGRLASATGAATKAPEPPDGGGEVQRDYLVVHYQRADGNYDGWGLHAWGDIEREVTWDNPLPFAGEDAYGRFAWVKLNPGATSVGFIAHKGDEKDCVDDRFANPSLTGEIWIKSGTCEVLTENPSPQPVPEGEAILHYHRDDGAYDGWGLHVWTGAANPTEWTQPLQPSGQDAYGLIFRVPLTAGATSLSYIVHKGDEKDLPADQSLDLVGVGPEVWILNGREGYLLPMPEGSGLDADLTKAKAQWIDEDTVVWDVAPTPALSYALVSSPDGSLKVEDGELTVGTWIRLGWDPDGLTEAQRAKWPHLAGKAVFHVDSRDKEYVNAALRGQVVAMERSPLGLRAATGVQLAGILDDAYGNAAVAEKLGPQWANGVPTLKVWAPTAQEVALELYDTSTSATPTVVPMSRDDATGTWSVRGEASWRGKFYEFRVKVWQPSVQQVVTTSVTDPYSVSLAANSTHSQLVDLADPALAPDKWGKLKKPTPVQVEESSIYELHVRDFSASDTTVPAAHRGGYLAFTDRGSKGMRHLKNLADAGMTYAHLLPVFDIASIPENKADHQQPACDLPSLPPDSEQQQACVGAVADTDAFNWGYDPFHYTAPEGSYASNPDGSTRVREFRQMVGGLNGAGLRVVMDVVYNHTPSAGQNATSVLDQLVPGYYQRLLDDGSVANSTCCANTAPENAMMGKLVVDSVVTWAKDYKVDGFRFDLMGHHPKANMLAVRAALDKLTVAKDGVDGKRILLYGEGWNFGEVANDARFVQATQGNMAGTGIGTFNDRLRDAVRGGGPFDANPRVQGFGSGLFTDHNGDAVNGTADEQRARLLHLQDLVKVGLTGNLKDYTFTSSSGATVKGSDVDYNGSPAGYTSDPQESITYVDAHDNETLFDALTYKLPTTTGMADRVRMQTLSLATAELSQGVAFVHAGSEKLRSKSLDRNSYNSGDWFNRYHVDCSLGNGFGAGLPPAADNSSRWDYARPLLANPALRPNCDAIDDTWERYEEFLDIRTSTPLFRLGSAAEVQRRLSFPLSGTSETPGVVTMAISDKVGPDLDARAESVTVVFNASDETVRQTIPSLRNAKVELHRAQLRSNDPVVKKASFSRSTGTLSVPARTVAVFVER